MKPLKRKIVKIPGKIRLIEKSGEIMHIREYLYELFHIMQKNVWSGKYENGKR